MALFAAVKRRGRTMFKKEIILDFLKTATYVQADKTIAIADNWHFHEKYHFLEVKFEISNMY